MEALPSDPTSSQAPMQEDFKSKADQAFICENQHEESYQNEDSHQREEV